jgi:hypothetical protein
LPPRAKSPTIRDRFRRMTADFRDQGAGRLLSDFTHRIVLMLLDFEVQRSTRRCAATDRPLEPGDVCYSVLESHGAEIIRKDYCQSAWTGPPSDAFGWWRSRIPETTAKKIKLAPNDVLLELFDQLAEQMEHQDMRYVLALLLLRRRVLRLDVPLEAGSLSIDQGVAGIEAMSLYCPKREATYVVRVAMPGEERTDEIQQRLSELLIADAK